MNAYIGWIVELSTKRTLYSSVKCVIIAKTEDEGRNKLIHRAIRSNAIETFNGSDHHSVVFEIEKLPQVGL